MPTLKALRAEEKHRFYRWTTWQGIPASPTYGVVMLPKVGSGCLPLESQYSRGKVGGKENLLYFQRLATGGEGRLVSKGQLLHWQSGGKSFQRGVSGAHWRREGLHAGTAQSALTSSWNWSRGGLTSLISIVFSTVNLWSQGRFVPISLRPVLGTVAA